MQNPPKKANQLAKYSGMAFQLLAYIVVGYFLGNFIDKYLQNQTPYGVAGCCTIFLIFGMYSLIKDVLRTK
jgi:F0F1-type ATP synthase assembly protein I